MAKLVVLSTPLQYDRFLQEGFDLKEFDVWCDDERYYDFFENEKVPFRKLEEDLIAEHWERINTWSCETAAKWVTFCRNNEIFNEIDWAMVICIIHGYLLAPILKFYHLSKFLIEQGKYHHVILFSEHGKKDYPQFLGNDYLNYFLELQCKTFAISTTKIDLGQECDKRNWQPETRSYFRATGLPPIKKIINKVYAFFAKPQKSFDVLAFGSLRHLSSTILELNKKGVKVALYDFEFHMDQFLFSLKEHIPYLLPESFPNRIYIGANQYAKQIGEQFDKAFTLCVNSDLYVYDGVDFKEFIQNYLFESMQTYFLRSAEKINHYKNITSVTHIKSVLVDDDFSVKGGIFAGYFTTNKIPVFCVSHANFAVNTNVSEQNCNFYQSYTFVNSEFEKANYIRRGWEPNHLVVTGTPRYDRLVSVAGAQRHRPNNGTCKILFCGTGLWSFSPDVYSYIGHQRECFGEVQIPVLQAVFSAIKGLPFELVIKPHSFEMLPLWKKLIKQSSVRNQIILKKHSDDIFELLSECDAMVLAYWSTTIIESAIAKKLTIFADFRRIKSQLLYEYSNKGFCYIVNSPNSLIQALQKVCDSEHSFFSKPLTEELKGYYLGQGDAKASERVSDFIIAKQDIFSQRLKGEQYNNIFR